MWENYTCRNVQRAKLQAHHFSAYISLNLHHSLHWSLCYVHHFYRTEQRGTLARWEKLPAIRFSHFYLIEIFIHILDTFHTFQSLDAICHFCPDVSEQLRFSHSQVSSLTTKVGIWWKITNLICLCWSQSCYHSLLQNAYDITCQHQLLPSSTVINKLNCNKSVQDCI